MNSMPFEEVVPYGEQVRCADTGTAWAFGDPIKQGGMGRVYEVEETQAPFRHGVIKMLRPDRDGEAAAFEREIDRHRAHLGGEGVPAFFGSGTFRGRRFVILQRAEPIPRQVGVKAALRLVDGFAAVLQAFYDSHVCHGDVKPGNMCLVNGRPGLLDLGSVRPLVPDGSVEPVTCTPGYTAPALAENVCATPWVDILGLSLSLNEILCEEARAVYADAIRARMDPRPDAQILSPAELQEAFHGCYANYRRHRLRRIVARVVSHTLVAVAVGFWGILTGVHFYRYKAVDEKRAERIEAKVCREAGIEFRRRGDVTNAVLYLRAAAKRGDLEARKELKRIRREGSR